MHSSSALASSPVPIAPPVACARLEADVAALRADGPLAAAGELEVFLAGAERLPHVLIEIGRLRELAFRQVGEGTGLPLDLDRFDDAYLHLFLWHRASRRIAGAYRLAPTDTLLGGTERPALYTETLFEFDDDFLEHVNPGLELGRAFVHPDWQRSPLALLLLWRGIGAYVARNPQRHRLFGPVSISNRYAARSRDLMLGHLAAHRLERGLAPLVRARCPHQGGSPHLGGLPADLDALDARVAEIELDARGVPILIREYLRLGGRVLGFNVDRSFGDAIDALVLVDLSAAPRRLLERYMGADAAASFWRAVAAPA